jgi:tetratricopeptide (TPR) repeat protein
LAALKVFTASQPQHPEAYARIGELMIGKGMTEEAIERMEAVGDAGADDPQLLAALAKGYGRSGRIDEAIAALTRAKQAAPANADIRRTLVDMRRKAGQTVEVLTELKELIEIDRDNETVMTYAGLLFDAKEYEQAADGIENILATDPQNIDALMLKGQVLRAQEKYTEAIDVYKEVSFIDSEYVPAIFERAETYFTNSQPTWAETFYKRTLKSSPKHARAVLGLAKIAKLKSQVDVYRQNVQRAYALDPGDALIRQEYESAMRK